MKKSYTLIISATIIVVAVLMPPASFSYPLSDTEGDCEECHSDFKAFTLTVDSPSEVPEDYDFEFKVIVRNTGEHEVRNLQAKIYLTSALNLESTNETGEPYHDETSGSVSFGSSETYSFPVSQGASSALIFLDGDEGLLGRNDIDLTVTSPEGREWVSESPGADEHIELDVKDLSRGGSGDYNVRVDYFIGTPVISFTLTIDVEYSAEQKLFEGPDLGPGEKHVFVLPLKSKAQGDNTIGVAVSANVYYEHDENEDEKATDSAAYTYEESWDLKVG
ncbi:MAG: hypothetical protein JSV56_09620, partial [Methanomassiliicoccales archaeon]